MLNRIMTEKGARTRDDPLIQTEVQPQTHPQTSPNSKEVQLERDDQPEPQALVETIPDLVPGLIPNLQYDLSAGLVVALVALPLCLGIAIASGADPLAGIISGVVGGIVIGMLSGSHVSVSGPAAGLAPLVMESLTELEHHFQAFQVAVVICGLIQIGLGFVKAGVIANYFPSAVIKGMLASIGIMLLKKQIPVAVGFHKTDLSTSVQIHSDTGQSFMMLLDALQRVTPGAVIISLISLEILLLWPKVPMKQLKAIPAPLVVVTIGALVNYIHQVITPTLGLKKEFLVSLPISHTPAEFFGQFSLPDFSHFASSEIWTMAINIAIIASLETLLNLDAADRIDKFRRTSDGSRELKAQGVGNIIAGMIGGIPITSVVVRGAVNVAAGGRTRTSAVVHGLVLLIAMMLIPMIIDLIPLASLAAILIVSGYKLTAITLYRDMYRAGITQFIPFITTVVGIVIIAKGDMLHGILMGVAINVLFLLWDHYNLSYSFDVQVDEKENKLRIVLAEHVSFLNKTKLANTLNALPSNTHIVIDGTKARAIDQDTLATIYDFRSSAPRKNIHLELKNIPEVHIVSSDH